MATGHENRLTKKVGEYFVVAEFRRVRVDPELETVAWPNGAT